MNPGGTPENLVASHPGGTPNLRHGLYQRPEVTDEVRELAVELAGMAPHIVESDSPALIECARLILLSARVDQALAADGRVESRGRLRALVSERRLLSAQLGQWFQLLGFTPDARATWTARLTRPSFEQVLERQRREVEARSNGAS